MLAHCVFVVLGIILGSCCFEDTYAFQGQSMQFQRFSIKPSDRVTCGDISEHQCTSDGCCWDEEREKCFLPTSRVKRSVNSAREHFRIDPTSGIVEVRHDGRWGVICDDYFHDVEASVLCRSLGYESGTVHPAYSSRRDFLLDNVNCDGYETSLLQCDHSLWGVHDCGSTEVVAVRCSGDYTELLLPTNDVQETVRLAGPSENWGRLEVYYNEEWGTVCDDGFGEASAMVACRSIGYSGGHIASRDLRIRNPPGRILLDDVRCVGTERHIGDCPHRTWGTHNCGHHEDVFLSCTGVTMNIRLVEGSNTKEGRVEVFHNREWGTVCDDNFSDSDAEVVCKSLSYQSGIARREAFFGPGRGRIWLDGVHCNGSESSLVDCQHDEWGITDCNHFEDAGVVCLSEQDMEAMVEFRIAGGSSSNLGRIEVMYSEQWGIICADEFGKDEAKVACRNLGYRFGFLDTPIPIEATDVVVLRIQNCIGIEDNLVDCAHLPFMRASCSIHKAAAIHCVDELVTTYPDPNIQSNTAVRLVDGTVLGHGRLEILHRNVYGTVCDDYFGLNEVHIVCRSLGFRNGKRVPTATYGPGTGQIWLDNVVCGSFEPNIESCDHRPWGQHDCNHREDVNIECSNKIVPATEVTGLAQFSVRLVNGTHQGSGRVEVYRDNAWGTVCSTGFANEEAEVVCRTAGFSNGTSITGNSYGSGDLAIWQGSLSCNGSETAIQDCNNGDWGELECSQHEAAAVECSGLTYAVEGDAVGIQRTDN